MSEKRVWLQKMGRFVGMAALCLSLLPAFGAPEIFVNQTSMGFGSVPDDRPVEHCFVVENRGDAVLSIERVTEDCEGCLSYVLETNSIAAGRSAIIELTLDTGVLDGNVAKNLVLHTNDPKTPDMILSLWGSVMPGYSVRPRSVAFGAIEKMSAVTQVVVIASNPGSTGQLSQVTSSSGAFKGVLSQGSTQGAWELKVSTVPPLPDGLTSGQLVVSGSNAAVARCVVRVAAYVPPVFSVLPERLLMKAIDEEQMMILFIRQNSSNPAELLDVGLPSSDFSCEINPGPGQGDYRVYVRAHGLAGKRGFAGNVILKTDAPAHAEVSVPVEVR